MAKKSKQVKTCVTDTIREVLNEAEINYEFHAEDNVFTFILSCENTDLNMVVHADDERASGSAAMLHCLFAFPRKGLPSCFLRSIPSICSVRPPACG